MSEKLRVYAFSEDKYIEYMNKIYLEKQVVNNLLFSEPYISDNMSARALLCEQYASCHHLEVLLEEFEDSFDAEAQEFYISEDQATIFTVLLSSLVNTKEELLKKAVSLSYH